MKQTMEKKVTEESKKESLDSLKGILETAPASKKKEDEDMIKLVEKLHVSKQNEPKEEDNL